jgi:hypothetical protein
MDKIDLQIEQVERKLKKLNALLNYLKALREINSEKRKEK